MLTLTTKQRYVINAACKRYPILCCAASSGADPIEFVMLITLAVQTYGLRTFLEVILPYFCACVAPPAPPPPVPPAPVPAPPVVPPAPPPVVVVPPAPTCPTLPAAGSGGRSKVIAIPKEQK